MATMAGEAKARGLRGWGRHAALALAALLSWAATAARAEDNVLALAPDPGFGGGGFQAMPYNTGANSAAGQSLFGLVHFDIAGGYLAGSLQQVNGNTRMVLARYTEAGQLDLTWGSNSLEMPGLGAPYAPGFSTRNVKLVVGQSGGEDIFYLAFNYYDGVDATLAVARFRANGAFDGGFGAGGYATTTLPGSLPGGHGAFLLGAAFTTVGGAPTMVMATRAVGNNKVVFVRAAGTGGSALSDDGAGLVQSYASALNVNQMRENGSGSGYVQLVGSLGTQGAYINYNAGSPNVTTKVFTVHCPMGTSASTIDAIERPSGFGSDVLLLARANCIGYGFVSLLDRYQNIDSSPSDVWTSVVGGASSCSQLDSPCNASLLAYSASQPDLALTVTGDGNYVPVTLSTHTVQDFYPEGAVGTNPLIQPSSYLGAVYRFPRLVGPASNPGGAGIGAVTVDRIFRGRFD